MTTGTPPVLSPFSPTAPPPRRTVSERVIGVSRADLAQQRLRHVLATYLPSEILPSDINRIMSDYVVHQDVANTVKATVWQEALEAFLIDGRLADDEQAYLSALRKLFDLGQDSIEAIEEQTTVKRFEIALSLALAKGALTQEAKEKLVITAQDLALPKGTAERRVTEVRRALALQLIPMLISDGLLTPEERQQLTASLEEQGLHLIPLPGQK